MSNEKVKKVLVVTACREGHRGHGAKGEYVIYKVWASNEQGEAVTEELRAFKPLNDLIGKPTEFEVERYDHATYGVSFTLHPPKLKTGERLGKLEHQVADLTARIAQLESRLTAADNAGSSRATSDSER